jgi:hypothetical protein
MHTYVHAYILAYTTNIFKMLTYHTGGKDEGYMWLHRARY